MIRAITFSELQQRFGGELINGDLAFERLVIDSRQVEAGDLFLAVKGARFDAHQFVPQVIEAGAAGLVVSESQDCGLPQWLVPDTQLALGQIGQFNRDRFASPVIGVTGNSGKTTVKEMLGAILTQTGNTLITQGNLNNEFGVPLTLLRLSEEYQSAVIELGANHLGEIAYTAALAQPHVGIVLNVTGAHVGEFGSMDNIAQAKGELITALGDSGIAVINADDAFAAQWYRQAGGRQVMLFSAESENKSRLELLMAADNGRTQWLTSRNIRRNDLGYSFELCFSGSEVTVNLQVPGRHNVSNALAAAAAAFAIGLKAEQIVTGLESFCGVSGRLQTVTGLKGATVLNDSYNANPGSVRVAIDTLTDYPGQQILVLGDIGELGDSSSEAHYELGLYAKRAGVDRLLTLGDDSEQASLAFGAGSSHWWDRERLIEELMTQLQADCTVLIKGSRAAAMELVVEAIKLKR
ncbi:UDP-N-acetylmuramoyl-tripeptide--D-alanyl-D-alanine ligase [Oceanospirillum beijerinckii]|uniref:UDP-N-acetylmuramoyl-tripeptide--D-alanyl-D- alanine ligase n=1 Tax=Oceanospirillum beijerinckii TaxID=64976 RepID=UPI0003FCD6BD|nr:UDP-N-acetylmuramoyl-tripeptide--D-alanyl-D-alanine ligase [Oceanospirillum beijerinckii]